MADEAELQARIAAISGKINHHKHQHTPLTPNAHHHQPHHYPVSIPRDYGRWTPYGRGGRGGGASRAQPYKNRSLVLGVTAKPAAIAASEEVTASIDLAPPAEDFVSTRGFGINQLMNKETYDREQKQKEQSRASKRQKVNRVEQTRLTQHTSTQGSRELVIDGIRFQLRDDGSKLMRLAGKSATSLPHQHLNQLNAADASDASKETPKKVKVADVQFFRTKHGNLVRANALKDHTRYRFATSSGPSRLDSHMTMNRPIHQRQKPQCEHFTKHGSYPSLHSGASQARPRTTSLRSPSAGKDLCSILTLCTGNCPYGPACRYSHDPNQVAVCKTFLHQRSCPAGDNCDLSHELTYHRVSACTHFLRGNCTNAACPYPHVHISLTAPVCRAFATTGYCGKGEECAKRHVVECPDYANHGVCTKHQNGSCSLPHPDRASTLRKIAARQAKIGSEGEVDVSSDEEQQDEDNSLDDIDSDEAEDVMMGGADDGSLTQQHDYIAFS